MRIRSISVSKSLIGLPDLIGFDFAAETMRRAIDSFFSSSPILFFRALLANPRAVGAACPSSLRLARAIAGQVAVPCDDGLILELGGGTGMVTAALLKRGIDPAKLVVVEQNKLLARHLKSRFPEIVVIHGNAVNLCRLCNRYGRHFGTVVSSLPLLSLPPVTVETLGRELQKMLGRHGSLIQYTYQLTNDPGPLAAYLEKSYRKIVWANLPPARVEIFRNPEDRSKTNSIGSLC